MELRHLILIDEQSQKDRLERISKSLERDGIQLIYEKINPNDCSIRQENGDLKFDKDTLKDKCKHSKKCTFYTLRFGCSFAAVNTIKPQLL